LLEEYSKNAGNIVKRYLIFLFLSFFSVTFSQSIRWANFNKALVGDKSKEFILVNVYADWCGYCKKMDNFTYNNMDLQNCIDKYYIPVKLNCDSKTSITINNKLFTTDELLAIWKIDGYPASVILDRDGNYICCIRGYKEAKDFQNILTYIGTKAYKEKKYSNYIRKEPETSAVKDNLQRNELQRSNGNPQDNIDETQRSLDEFAKTEKELTEDVINPKDYILDLQTSIYDEDLGITKELKDTETIIVKNNSIKITGWIKTTSMLKKIVLNNEKLRVGEDKDRWVFFKKISLHEGENPIQIMATDAFDNKKEITIKIIYKN
jgi:thioredoxin-related protein